MIHRLSIIVVLIAILAACGGAPAVIAPATSGSPAAPTSATGALTSVPASAPDAGDTTRMVTHAFGTTEVPLRPKRVVALDAFFTLTPLIELGVPVIGSVSLGEPADYPGLSAEERVGITSVGNGDFGSLEVIAALKPDLIIGVDFVDPPYDALSQIAPTVIIPTALDWKAQHRAIGEATGTLGRAEEGIAAYETRVAALKARMPAVTASYLSLTGETPGLYLLGPQAWAPIRVLDEAGVQRPADEQTTDASFYKPVSLEVLPDLTGDVLLYAAGYPGLDAASAGYAPAVLSTPIWQQIPAVKAGRVYQVNGACWETFGGLRSANCVLDEIERIFLAAAPAEGAARSITHAMGVTDVAASPQRVVVLDTSELDNALALGITPVGAPVAEAREYQSYLADQLAGIADIGTISEPNLEAILALKPDLILGSKQRYEAIYPQLSTIAPTVFVESLRVPWQQNFRLHAEALGKAAKVEELLAAYDAQVAALQAILGDTRGSTTISVIRFRPGQVRLYLKSSFIGYILQDVGLGRPASQDRDEFSAEITLEQIADVDADYLFITGYAQDDSAQDTFLQSPLWLTLGAVQNERAIDVDDDTWIAGLGVQAATLVLEDLTRLLGAAQ